MLDAVLAADLLEAANTPANGLAVTVARQVGELDTVIGEDVILVIGHALDQRPKEPDGGWSIGLLVKLGEHELRGAVDPEIEVQLAFFGTDPGDVDAMVGDQVRP